MSIKSAIIVSSISISLTACSFVDLSEEGKKVRLLDADEVTKCTYLGKSTSSTKSKVVGIGRNENVLLEELTNLARNSAINLDGDTIVQDGDIVEGKLKFLVYRCVPR